MIERPIILVDMDDTTVETINYWTALLNKEHNLSPRTHGPLPDIKTWYPELTAEQVYEPLRAPGFFRNLKPREGALDTIREWLNAGFDVRFASVVYPDCPFGYADKLVWIDKHIPEMSNRTIIFSSHDKTLLYGTVLIDDHPTHIKDAAWPLPICMAQSWNTSVSNRIRVDDWKQAKSVVNSYLRWKGMCD